MFSVSLFITIIFCTYPDFSAAGAYAKFYGDKIITFEVTEKQFHKIWRNKFEDVMCNRPQGPVKGVVTHTGNQICGETTQQQNMWLLMVTVFKIRPIRQNRHLSKLAGSCKQLCSLSLPDLCDPAGGLQSLDIKISSPYVTRPYT